MGFRRAKSTQENTNCQKNIFEDDQVQGHHPRALKFHSTIGFDGQHPVIKQFCRFTKTPGPLSKHSVNLSDFCTNFFPVDFNFPDFLFLYFPVSSFPLRAQMDIAGRNG